MRMTTLPFDLRAWRQRMNWTQPQAALALGKSVHGYRRAEYRSMDREGAPCEATVVLLAQAIEREREKAA